MEDFENECNGDKDKGSYYFDTWAGFYPLCPDIPQGEGFSLLGTPTNMITNNFSFIVKKCLNKPHCKSEKEIDNWIRDL